MKPNLLLVLGAVVAVALIVVTGLVVDRAAGGRTEELLERADRLATGRAAELDDIHRVLNDIAAGLGEKPCSPRVLRLTCRLLPDRWEFNASDLDSVGGGGALASVRIRDDRSPQAAKRLSC